MHCIASTAQTAFSISKRGVLIEGLAQRGEKRKQSSGQQLKHLLCSACKCIRTGERSRAESRLQRSAVQFSSGKFEGEGGGSSWLAVLASSISSGSS